LEDWVKRKKGQKGKDLKKVCRKEGGKAGSGFEGEELKQKGGVGVSQKEKKGKFGKSV